MLDFIKTLYTFPIFFIGNHTQIRSAFSIGMVMFPRTVTVRSRNHGLSFSLEYLQMFIPEGVQCQLIILLVLERIIKPVNFFGAEKGFPSRCIQKNVVMLDNTRPNWNMHVHNIWDIETTWKGVKKRNNNKNYFAPFRLSISESILVTTLLSNELVSLEFGRKSIDSSTFPSK